MVVAKGFVGREMWRDEVWWVYVVLTCRNRGRGGNQVVLGIFWTKMCMWLTILYYTYNSCEGAFYIMVLSHNKKCNKYYEEKALLQVNSWERTRTRPNGITLINCVSNNLIFQGRSHSEVPGVRTSTHENWKGWWVHNSLHRCFGHVSSFHLQNNFMEKKRHNAFLSPDEEVQAQ